MKNWFKRPFGRGGHGLKEVAALGTPVLIILVAGFAVAFNFVEPAPPDRIEIATGGRDGAYFAFARRYRDIVAKQGIDLVVRETSGSLENLRLLNDDASGVQLALVQGGIAEPDTSPKLESLASLYREPVWVFHDAGIAPTRLSELRGKRIAVGPEGSGTRVMGLRLLAENGLVGHVKLSSLGGNQAASALRQRRVDAVFFIGSIQAAYVRRLLSAQGIGMMSFTRAGAYVRRHRYLSSVTMPTGMFDLARNIPPRDTVLIAPTAGLVARRDLHPALVGLLMGAVTAVHGRGGMFETAGEFPSRRYLDLPLNSDAKRYLKSGPSFLQRYLPFWIANFLDRTKVMLVPLITLMIPLMRILPPVYRWRMRSRIIRSYKRLGQIERSLAEQDAPDLAKIAAELDRIEDEVLDMNISSGYLDAVYALRLHIGHVRSRIVGSGVHPQATD